MYSSDDWIWRSAEKRLNYDLSFFTYNGLKIHMYKKLVGISQTRLLKDKFSKKAFIDYERVIERIEESLKELNVKYQLKRIKNHPKKYSGKPYGTYILTCNIPSKTKLELLEELSDKKFIENVKTLPIFTDIISFVAAYSMSPEIDKKSDGISYISFDPYGIKIKSKSDNEGYLYAGEVNFDFKKHGYGAIPEEKLYSLVLACVRFFDCEYKNSLIWDLESDNYYTAVIKHKFKPTETVESPLKQW